LEGLGRYVEPTGAVESSRRNPQSCVEENSNTTGAGDPTLRRDPAYRIDAASGTESISWRARSILSIGLVCGGNR